MNYPVRNPYPLDYNPCGWMTTLAGEGLAIRHELGSTTTYSLDIQYVLV